MLSKTLQHSAKEVYIQLPQGQSLVKHFKLERIVIDSAPINNKIKTIADTDTFQENLRGPDV